MTTPEVQRYAVKFPSRKDRTVKRVTKCETREIQKRLEPPKPEPIRPSPKAKVIKKPKLPPPATLCKPPRSDRPARPSSGKSAKQSTHSMTRTLQTSDVEKLARLNCSREFSLFHQYIKSQLSKAYENQLAFLQTKLQHLKNDFVNKQAEHLNFQQIKEYYEQAVKENIARSIKPDEYLTLCEKFKQDTKQAIDKWIRKKEFKPPRQVNEYLKRRQARIRDQIKETIIEQKKQQQLAKETEEATQSRITISSKIPPATVDDDDDIMIID